MRRDKVECRTVTPKPYFRIIFSCGNRAFYDVLNDIIEVGEPLYDLDKENVEDYVEQKCDYEGDLEELIIYDDKFKKAILEFYSITEDIGDKDIHLSIF